MFSYGNNLGYTIVSGDDRLPAIVGYTDNGNYDVENLPTNLKSFMQAYQDFAETATDEQIAEIKAWKANATSHAAVAPFMKEKWDQGEPYNNMCPEYQSGEKSVTGCVATAVAQILHYHNCPNNLKATIPAYKTRRYGINMPAIPEENGSYDWENMLNEYTGSETQAQNDAVATLMLHVGCAVEMDYGPLSLANATPETFTKYFGMDQDLVRYCDREDYQIAEWNELLYKEMDAKRPVYYDGQSTGGGHAFVIHGYEDGLYYVNWGWGGYCDGYFDITILNPHSNQGAGASSSNDGYSFGNSMIIGIQPDNNDVDDISYPAIGSTKKLQLSNERISDNTLSGTVGFGAQNLNLHGIKYVSIGYKENDGNYKNIGDKPEVINSNNLSFGYSYTNLSMNISFSVAEGETYQLCLIESTDKEKWIACDGEKSTALKIKIENGEPKVVEDDKYILTATAQLNKESGGYAGMSNTIDITVNNTGDKEYYNKIYVKVSSETMPEECVLESGITAPANDRTTINFSYTPPSEGEYNFWILDANSNEIGNSSITFAASEAPKLSFVSIRCTNASGKKVYADFQGDQVEMDKVNDTKAEFIFEINNDGGYYEGIFYFYLYHQGQGNWPYETSRTLKIPGNATTKFTFTVEGNAGDVVGYALKSANVIITELTNKHDSKREGYYWPLVDREICYLAGYKSEYTRNENTTQGKWNTICLPFNCAVPEGITVEEFEGIEGNYVKFKSVSTMTAGTPYIFKANGNENVDFGNGTDSNHITEAKTTEGEGNAAFVGVLDNTVIFNKSFRKNGNYIYYGINPATNEFQELTETAICTPYHAYLKVENPANGARALAIVHGDDNTTGINDVNNAEQKQVIYNLNGQRINSPQKGINIINGRKVIIK